MATSRLLRIASQLRSTRGLAHGDLRAPGRVGQGVQAISLASSVSVVGADWVEDNDERMPWDAPRRRWR